MKSLTICLPDVAFERASANASHQRVDLASLCSSILADHFLSTTPRTRIAPQSPPPGAYGTQRSISASKNGFNVAECFPHFPSGSIRFAQAFVDEALKFSGVEAFQVRRGIGFKPNFVFIEYLMSRGGKAGIGVSFYGEPNRHKNPPPILVSGIPSYSRAKIYSDADLRLILPHIRQSHELKFGS
jgi:hypothetical protein